ncbi:MAG: hypothetical protein Q4C03_06135, partial [bacterium]|nr:hypothetical protein [bacterium]
LWQNTDTEKADYQNKLDELDRKRIKENTDWSLHQIDVEHEAELKRLELQHIKEGTSEENYQLRKDQLIEQHLRRRRDYLRNPKNGASAAEIQKAEEAHETETNNQALRRQQNYFKQLADLRKQYSTKSLQEQRDIQLAMLDELHAKGLVKEEEYQFLLKAIREKHTNDSKQHTSENVSDILRKGGYTGEKADTQTTYGTLASAIANYATLKDASKDAYQHLREQREKDLIDQQTYNEQVKALDRMRFTSFATMAQEAYSQVSAMMSSYSAFSQASTDAEVAKVEARYDKEIQAAGNNTEKAKKLEEQKTKEINAIKKKELKKQTAVQIAQAFASTAMNAILAYQDMLALGIPAGPVLAPIAAATAVAAGMLQIATIKKQAQAQLAEYYTGGFTGGSNYRRTAGIVHEGEFVANHQAVNNPNVLPILRLIDHAQKNNTIGSLTPEDISRTIAAPAITAAATEITSAAPLLQESLSDQRTAEVLERLNDRLDNLHAIVTLTGPDGLEEQQKKYDKLKRRK